jgi:hypothetical protein
VEEGGVLHLVALRVGWEGGGVLQLVVEHAGRLLSMLGRLLSMLGRLLSIMGQMQNFITIEDNRVIVNSSNFNY